MQIIRKIVDRKNIQAIAVPEEFGEKVEIIVLPLDTRKKYINRESEYLMQLQEDTGFAARVLADKNEDVWNDI